ncbi:TBC1 domain family member 24 [Halotydeus destructor]|nr:TBC1 domain family member 24 [Halotydeus destructor]
MVLPSSYSNATEDISLIKDLIKTRNTVGLKILVRRINWETDEKERATLWKLLCGNLKKSRSTPVFDDEVSAFIDNTPPQSPHKLPGFVDLTYCRHFDLDISYQRSIEKVLWSVAREHPEVTYCPLLYPLAALFLQHVLPKEAFTSLSYLLEFNYGSDSQQFLPQTKTELAKDGYVLVKLTNKFGFIPNNNFCKIERKKLKEDHEIDEAFVEWTKWIFIGLPRPHLVRIIDCYLVEGMKILFRVALAIISLYLDKHSNDEPQVSLDAVLRFCQQIELTPNDLLKLATGLRRLSKAKISKIYRNAENDMRKHPSMSAKVANCTPVPTPCLARRSDMITIDSEKIHISTRIAPRNFKSNIIDWYLFDIIWDWLPQRLIVKEPMVVFCTDEDGSSLRTFFSKCDSHDATILLLKTTSNEIFGAYCSETWHGRFGREGEKGATSQYFGTGESFLFSLSPTVAHYPWVGAGSTEDGSPKTVPHSSQLFMSANNKQLIVGSGGGNGLWIDEELTRGKTESCDTFLNKPLCPSSDFECSIVEVLAFHFYTTNRDNSRFLADYAKALGCQCASEVCICSTPSGNVTAYAAVAAVAMEHIKVGGGSGGGVAPPAPTATPSPQGSSGAPETSNSPVSTPGAVTDPPITVTSISATAPTAPPPVTSDRQVQPQQSPVIDPADDDYMYEGDGETGMGLDPYRKRRNAHQRPKRQALSLIGYNEDLGNLTGTEEPLQAVGLPPYHPKDLSVSFKIFTSSGDAVQLDLFSDLLEVPRFHKLFVIIPGFAGVTSDEDYERMKQSLFESYPSHEVGVLMVDWNLGGPWRKCDAASVTKNCIYATQAASTVTTGRHLAVILDMVTGGMRIDPEDVHMIAFDLGCHIGRVAGTWFTQISRPPRLGISRHIGRLTALDPSTLYFSDKIDFKGSALFVDVIHTSELPTSPTGVPTDVQDLLNGLAGIGRPVGNLDIYPNGGKNQTICKSLYSGICNHAAALRYFILSLDPKAPPSAFDTFPCSNYELFDQCAEIQQQPNGFSATSSMGIRAAQYCGKGKHYLKFDERSVRMQLLTASRRYFPYIRRGRRSVHRVARRGHRQVRQASGEGLQHIINPVSCGTGSGSPWLVAILENDGNDFVCSGVVINQNWILTAAHCLANRPANWVYKARFGTTDWKTGQNEKEFTLTNSIVFSHRNFQYCGYANNVALVKFADPIYNEGDTQVNAVCVPTVSPAHFDYGHPRNNATIAGWSSRKGQSALSSSLAPVVASWICNRMVLDHTVEWCLNTTTTCEGEAGSPVTAQISTQGQERTFMVGMVSHIADVAPVCDDNQFPPIVLRADRFVSWMSDTLKQSKSEGTDEIYLNDGNM